MMELIKQRKRLSEPEVRFYMLQLVHTIRHLHQRQVIHRDLKLGNLFLGETLDIKLGDFGLAAKIEFDGERRKYDCFCSSFVLHRFLDTDLVDSFFAPERFAEHQTTLRLKFSTVRTDTVSRSTSGHSV
jgi:serine/threonine protein kinase